MICINPDITIKKLELYASLLEKSSRKKFEPIKPLKGFICAGDSDKDYLGTGNKELLVLTKGTVWSNERRRFYVSGSFTAFIRKDCDSVLLLELGKSTSAQLLSFLYGPEAVVSIDRKRYSGLDPNHSLIYLIREYCDGIEHSIEIEGWTGISDEKYIVGELGVCYIHRASQALSDILSSCLEVVKEKRDAYFSRYLLEALNDVMNGLDLTNYCSHKYYENVRRVEAAMRKTMNRVEWKPPLQIAACGHGHLDLAWLWRTDQAVKKGARTFLNALRLMERYSDFKFSQTQAQLYEWIENQYPEIFEQIQEKAAAGQWEVLGGMWVESDCCISGAESLIRQFLLFHEYMHDRFPGQISNVAWLPDTFGFCGQLPQLMRSAGINYFATAKLTWNQYNKMPAEYFWWQGIDGSRVLSYIVSASRPGWWGATYSADLTAAEIYKTVDAHKSAGLHNEMLIAYGNGDGGGGPADIMIRRAHILDMCPGIASVKCSKFIDFFKKLESEKGERLPQWNGELYFELHRGTYTSQSETKKLNRLCEAELHNVEFLTTWASDKTDMNYPYEDFKGAWKSVCKNQFHDILPGSSIGAVYCDAYKDYQEVLELCNGIEKTALEALDKFISADAIAVVYNTTPFSRTVIAELPISPEDGETLISCGEEIESYTDNNSVLIRMWVPSYGFRTVSKKKSCKAYEVNYSVSAHGLNSGSHMEKGYTLENDCLLIEFDSSCDIVQITDKASGRKLMSEGCNGNEWRLYEDRPADWDAWDIDVYYKEKAYRKAVLIKAEPYRKGHIINGLSIKKKIWNSYIFQNIYITHGSKLITFDTEVDFHGHKQLLRVNFPVNISNDFAAFGTQFGAVHRPTHFNTSWEQAKFETPMHHWADYSEGDYGVSIISDFKYGVDIHENNISLAVLKGAEFPDPNADQGTHNFTYCLFPHEGCELNETMKHAYSVCNPAIVHIPVHPCGSEESASFVSCEKLVIETVKRAENGARVIRAYDAYNSRGKDTITFEQQIKDVRKCNILDAPEETLQHGENSIPIEFRPYEIISVMVE